MVSSKKTHVTLRSSNNSCCDKSNEFITVWIWSTCVHSRPWYDSSSVYNIHKKLRFIPAQGKPHQKMARKKLLKRYKTYWLVSMQIAKPTWLLTRSRARFDPREFKPVKQKWLYKRWGSNHLTNQQIVLKSPTITRLIENLIHCVPKEGKIYNKTEALSWASYLLDGE